MSAKGIDLKSIARSRIRGAKLLIDGGDPEGAAQMMGFALECALKAAICKTLRIPNYPDSHKDKKVPDFFMTHTFDRLLLLLGLSDIFSVTGNPQAFNNWGEFTIKYPGEWTGMRYTESGVFTQSVVETLFKCLYSDDHAIMKMIAIKKRW